MSMRLHERLSRNKSKIWFHVEKRSKLEHLNAARAGVTCEAENGGARIRHTFSSTSHGIIVASAQKSLGIRSMTAYLC